MQDKNFFETAMLNKTGKWNGYAEIEAPYLSPNINSILRFFGVTITKDADSEFKKIFRHSYENVYSTTLFQTPSKIENITIVDKSLESNYGTINTKSLKKVKQCNIQFSFSKGNPSKEIDGGTDFQEFKIWLLFKVRPSIKLENRSFHIIHILLKYVYDHTERNVPRFEIQANIPGCLVKESIKNPEFIKELRMKLNF